MKANHRFILLLVVAFGILSGSTGCKKFRENREYFTLQDHNAAENAYNDIFRLVCQKGDANSAVATDSCYTAVTSGTTFPKTCTFTFVNGCHDLYQGVRTGGLTITYDKDFSTSGAVASVALGSGYAYNGYLIQGDVTITYTGLNTAGHKVYTMVVSQSSVTTPKNGSFTWKCNHTLELTDAVEATFIFDDLFNITGTASGTDHEGHAFQVAIQDHLVKEQSCRWPRSGNITITIDGLDEKEVDYSSNDCTSGSVGCCDNVVSVKTDGKRQENLKLE